jgi:hypothetical protein
MRNKTLVEDRLDGSNNFNSWKSRLQIILEEDDLLSVIQKDLPETVINEWKEERKEDNVKARKIIIYSMRDHLLPRISNLKIAYEMYEALNNIFESNNTLRALTLKGQLQNIKMKKDDIVATFFMKISEIRDQLGSIGEIISNRELVLTTLNALPRHWEPFLQSINGREQLPTFDHLWTDCTQEEIKLIARGVEDSPHDDNNALSFHTNKGGRNRINFIQALKDEKTSSTSGYDPRKTNQISSVSYVTSMDTMR